MNQERTFLGHVIPPLDAPGLRKFGLIFSGIISVLFGLILPFLFDFSYPVWPWIAAAVIALPALVYPRSLNPLYQVWMRFGAIMNIITSRIILGAVFFLTVVPAGLIFKLRRKDILDLQTESELSSYRKQSESGPISNLKKPY